MKINNIFTKKDNIFVKYCFFVCTFVIFSAALDYLSEKITAASCLKR